MPKSQLGEEKEHEDLHFFFAMVKECESSEAKSLGSATNGIMSFSRNSSFQLVPQDETAVAEPVPLQKKSLTSEIFLWCKQIRINWPLIPLKICLFFFFAAGAAVAPFLQVHIVQLGLSVQNLSVMYMINPVVYFLGPAISGIVADKIGRSKPVFVANLVLAVVSLNGMLLIPTVNSGCRASHVTFTCLPGEIQATNMTDVCSSVDVLSAGDCRSDCTNDTIQERTRVCFRPHPTCEAHTMGFNRTPVIFPVTASWSTGQCSKNLVPLLSTNNSQSLCDRENYGNCTLTCNLERGDNCTEDNFALVFTLSLVLLLTFTTVMSNCYRIMDVTAMSMVKDHNSDFGRVRFWSILSSAVIPPLSGFLVDATSTDEARKNYAAAFYLFNLMVLAAAIAVWKLDVRINPPGKKMWKKTLMLLKKPDILAFALAVLVLGTSWGFTKNFSNVYLKFMDARSLLLGLLVAANSLSGLPFLLTSNWFVEKIGPTNLLLFGFFGYIAYGIGYYFLVNPWYAIIYEFTSVFTYHLLWVAVVRHCHASAPEGLTATVIASAGGIHYGIGKGTGSLIGGYVRSTSENNVDPLAYLAISGACAAAFVSYGSFLLFRSRRSRNFQEDGISGKADDKLEKMEDLP